ncbi:hypothetical protein CLV24_13134 [Pontibacter ummariensis]|uniref:Uncharacterized protein n=1 Tax=Pontibacter ummariensis TaxID=1610492 RepID=A0A239KUL8_9BACT|nr:hypothetical protein CLV24_13134 [Pontibacter ummariensis]SNT21189.1 hypothetical protein SAMN06296052_13134 [Pontibacter ummariensis]
MKPFETGGLYYNAIAAVIAMHYLDNLTNHAYTANKNKRFLCTWLLWMAISSCFKVKKPSNKS